MAIDDRQRALKSPLRHYTIEISPDGEVVTIELISPDGEVVDVVGSREDEPARFFGLAMWQRLGASLSAEAASLVDRVCDPLYEEEEEDENDPDERAMSRQYKCGNCDFVTDDLSEVHEVVSHIEDRVAPGEVMPHGECPKCGALVHDRDVE